MTGFVTFGFDTTGISGTFFFGRPQITAVQLFSGNMVASFGFTQHQFLHSYRWCDYSVVSSEWHGDLRRF
jgi:hypothetical protein